MSRKEKWRKVIGTIGIVAILGGALSGCGSKPAEDSAANQVVDSGTPVETMITSRAGFDKVITLGGVTAADSTVNVIAKVSGMEQIEAVNVKVGDKVSAGQVLAQLNTESTQINQSNAQLAYDNALRDYNNMQPLYEAGAVSKSNMDQLEMALRNAENNLRSIELALNYATVTAPISGTITMVNAEKGSYASASQPMFEIANVDTLKITTGINEQNVSKIKEGQEVLVRMASYSDQWFSSKITEISKVMNVQTKNYPITIALSNKDDALVAGMYAEINVIVDHAADALLVPVQSIVYKDGKPMIYVVNSDGKSVKQCEVTLGLDDGDTYQVLSGIEAGSEIVIKGNSKLVDGELVTIMKPVEEVAKEDTTTEGKTTDENTKDGQTVDSGAVSPTE